MFLSLTDAHLALAAYGAAMLRSSLLWASSRRGIGDLLQQQPLAAVACCIGLRALAAAGLDRNMSVKLTQLGLDMGEEVCFGNLLRLLDAGAYPAIATHDEALIELRPRPDRRRCA